MNALLLTSLALHFYFINTNFVLVVPEALMLYAYSFRIFLSGHCFFVFVLFLPLPIVLSVHGSAFRNLSWHAQGHM